MERPVNEYLLSDRHFSTSPRLPYDDEAFDDANGAGIHLATVAEKKSLWWRNAIINALFIASWFGLNH